MTAMSQGAKYAIIFGAIGIGITLIVVDNQTEGLVFQRAIEDDNPWDDPTFFEKI